MKKRILFLIPTLAHGGAEKVLVNLVNNLSREKYDITVKTLFDVGVNRQYLDKDVKYIGGIKRQFRGNSHFFKLFSPKSLYKYICEDGYDIVVSYLEGVTARIVSGNCNKNTKTVCWIHTELSTPRLISRAFRTVHEAQQSYKSFDHIVAVSKNIKCSFLEQLNVNTNFSVLYNTNETSRIVQEAKKPIDCAAFKIDDISICSVGKLIKVKGFDRLLEAHKRLIDEGYRHRIYILGIGEEQKFLESKIKEYGVEDSFILLGYKDNPYKYVSRCDLYVCSSRREGFSTAVTESLIVGTPVVSTDCSGAKELLGENNEYGIVVENSEDGIYGGLKQMLSNPKLLLHYKEKAAQRGKFFSKEKTVKAVEDMLDSL